MRCAADAAGLFREIDRAPADAILLDVAMPAPRASRPWARLRHQGVAAGVLLLTAADTEPDRIRGLLAGADDYITKPFIRGSAGAAARKVLRHLPASAAPPPAQVVPLGACATTPAPGIDQAGHAANPDHRGRGRPDRGLLRHQARP